jgi:acetyl-CoA acetyltransferase
MSGAFVVGAGVLPMGKHDGALVEDLALDAIEAALRDAGLPVSDIDGLFSCPHGFLRERERFLTQRMAQRLHIAPRAVVEMDAGGTTSALTFQAAVDAVTLGRCRCALVWASEVELRPERLLAEITARRHLVFESNALYGPYDGVYGLLSVVPMYAMATQRYMYDHRVPAERIAGVAVVLREHARENPIAVMKQPLTVEDVLASRVVSPPIHLLESCPWANGAAAVLVASEEVAKRTRRPVEIIGTAEAHDAESFFPTRADGGRFPSVARATREALERARVVLDDIDVFEVYGAFAGVELMCYEELGIFAPGTAPAAVAEGRTRVGHGDRVVNPSGGRLSCGHPPYVTPLVEVAEVATQLRGEAGGRQVKGAEVGLAQSEHGMINGAAVSVLRRVA